MRGEAGGGGGGDLGKERRLPVPNIPGDERENQSTGGKTISGKQRKPYVNH